MLQFNVTDDRKLTKVENYCSTGSQDEHLILIHKQKFILNSVFMAQINDEGRYPVTRGVLRLTGSHAADQRSEIARRRVVCVNT